MATQPADQPGIKGQTLPVARSGTAGDGGAEGMARVLHCECGCVARGATDDAVLDDVMAHLGPCTQS